MVPWPDRVEEERTNEETHEDTSAAELSAVTVSAEKVDVVPLPEDVASDSRLDPPVTASEDRDLLAEREPGVTDVTEVRVLEDVRDVPPAYDAVEETGLQPAKDILDYLLDRLERLLLAPPETSEQRDRQSPLVAEDVDEAAAPLAEEPVESNASSPQTAGVETGVEMLDLPTPKYPSLSRRRGEEGLVLLQVEVLPDGTVGDIAVLRDAGYRRLTEAAISAARKGRFKPATRDGHAIRATVRIPFRFVLTLPR